MSTTSIRLKKSSVAGRIPATSDLEYGEIAINITDGILYFKNSSNQVSSINARAIGVDSTATFSIIDSAYIQNRIVDGFDSNFAQKTTSDLTEGTRLYYTTSRSDSDFDARLATKSTTNLSEGSNLYYTTARTDSDAKRAISVTDAGGDGSLSYNTALGVLTYTGPSASEVRAHFTGGNGITLASGNIKIDSANVKNMFSAGGDLSYNSGTGQFNIDVSAVYTADDFDSDYILALDSANTAVERNKHTDTTKEFSVEVASKDQDHVYFGNGSGQGYKIDGTFSPVVHLQLGRTYQFNLSSSNMSSHPFRFYYNADKSGGQYTSGVSTSSTYARITVSESTPPVLHYQCSAHGYMGHALVIGTRNLTGFTTTNLGEGTNLYYTDTRFDTRLSSKSTSNLTEGGNLYYTDARVQSLVDSSYVQARQVDLQRDSAFTTNIVDSSYVQARQVKYTNADFTDSAFVTTQINNLIDAAPGALNTLNELASAINDDANFSTTITNQIAGKLDSSLTIGLIDSAYVQARQVDLQRDSAFTTNIVDSAYVQARTVAGTDSAATQAMIDSSISFQVDSAYVQARQVDLQRDSGFITNIIDSSYVQLRQSSTGTTDSAAVSNIILADVDSSYVQARQVTTSGTDSAAVISIIDSNYVQARQVTTSGTDSATVIALIDSAYVQSRQVDLQRDSGFITNIIDSSYVGARQDKITVLDEGSALSTTAKQLNFVGAGVTATGSGSLKTITISGGGSGITVQDEGSSLSTLGTTLNFVGAGVTTTGSGSTKTITITGANVDVIDSADVIKLVDSAYVQARQVDSQRDSAFVTSIVNTDYINRNIGVDYGDIISNATNALDLLLASFSVDYGSFTAPSGLRSDYGASYTKP